MGPWSMKVGIVGIQFAVVVNYAILVHMYVHVCVLYTLYTCIHTQVCVYHSSSCYCTGTVYRYGISIILQ